MQYNFKLKSERTRFYKSNPWRGVNGARAKAVERDKECVWCREEGLVTPVNGAVLEVDHIKELEHCTYEEAIDLNNLRTLCSHHHNVRHNRFDGAQRKWNDEQW